MADSPPTAGLSLGIDALIEIIKNQGFSFVLAVLALYTFVGYIPHTYGDLEQIKQEHLSMKQDLSDLKTALAPTLEQLNRKQDESNRILCATCWNAAQDAQEINRCSCNPRAQ